MYTGEVTLKQWLWWNRHCYNGQNGNDMGIDTASVMQGKYNG